MQITPPYGFQEIVLLEKTQRVLLPKEGLVHSVFDTLNPLPLSLAEFPAAARDYPVVFITADGGKTHLPVAVLGLERNQNLFVIDGQRWDPRAYVPAYVRRYPFCMTRVSVDGSERPERVACVAKHALSSKGKALFDDKGNPVPEWEKRQKLLFEFEADLARTEELCRLLTELKLLEPFTMQAATREGPPRALAGMLRVTEQRLNALPENRLKELLQKGALAPIYAHLLSLANFQRLLDRWLALDRKSKQAAEKTKA